MYQSENKLIGTVHVFLNLSCFLFVIMYLSGFLGGKPAF